MGCWVRPTARSLVIAMAALGAACAPDADDNHGGDGMAAAAGGSTGSTGGGALPQTGADSTSAGAQTGGGATTANTDMMMVGGDMSPASSGASGMTGVDMPAGSGSQAGSGMMDAGMMMPAVDSGTDMTRHDPGGGDGDGDASGTDGVAPSAGCNAGSGRPAGGVVAVSQSHYFFFPASYDGTEPLPVLFGFHGCGGVNRGTTKDDTEWARLTKGTSFEGEYVRVVPLSADGSGCWNYNTDVARVKAAYDDLVASYCVDERRVFATGHSSGAQFIVQLVGQSHTADAQHFGFKALAPVAASDYGPIAGPIPVMYIQGMMDRERGNGDGHETVERFRAANSCGSTSMPYTQVAGCQSGSTSVNPGCVSYDGCAVPTLWCSHNDPQYSGTMHGVPCFAMTAMYDFFESL